jgi:hypothetical protein
MGGVAQHAKTLTAAYIRMAREKPTTQGRTPRGWHRFLYTLLSTGYVLLVMTLLRSYGFAVGMVLSCVAGVFIHIPALAALQLAADRMARRRTDRTADSSGRPTNL